MRKTSSEASGAEALRKSMIASREATGLGLRSFAKLLGISHTHLARIESGTHEPSREIVVRAAEIIGFDPDVLLALAGRIASEYTDSVRCYPNLFITLFQLFLPANTPVELAESLETEIAGLREVYRLGKGEVQVDTATLANLFGQIGAGLQELRERLTSL